MNDQSGNIRMLSKEALSNFGLDPYLVQAVRSRIDNGQYADAVLAAFRYLSDFMREKSGEDGDGAQLVGKVLGGAAPLIRLNELQTTSQLDEQKGIEQLVRGLYIGIRNPRTHESMEDSEEFCIRVLITIDTMLQYLRREVADFDVTKFTDRIYDQYFVPTQEYADSLASQVPPKHIFDVFTEAFGRREQGDASKTRFAFEALYQRMPQEELKEVARMMGDALRTEGDTAKILSILGIMRPDLWPHLHDDVRLRLEFMIREESRKGRYDAHAYSGLQGGNIGTWGLKFGKYFSTKAELSSILLELLHRDWYTQNYVGMYYMYALPEITDTPEGILKTADALAYALVTNKAKVLRQKFKEVCHNYPPSWKEPLRVALQARNDHDPSYIADVMPLLA
jgi:uncharacterized protein (TIGR02391 family)